MSQDEVKTPEGREDGSKPDPAPRWSRRTLLKAGVAAGVAAGAVSFPFLNIRYKAAKRNVILIVCDALRADRVGLVANVNGVLRSLTPTIDALARDGVSFAQAKSPSTFTGVSMLSFMYDEEPTRIRFGYDEAVSPDRKSLPQFMKESGYVTLFASANEILDFEYTRAGFDAVEILRTHPETRRRMEDGFAGILRRELYGPLLNSRIYSLLRRHRSQIEKKPLYLQVHYMDTHQPYNITGFKLDVPFDSRICATNLNKAIDIGRKNVFHKDFTLEEAVRYLFEYYDSSVCALDRYIAELVAELEERKILDDCLLVVTADHGEEFDDNTEIARRHVGHGGPMNEVEVHVPLVLQTRGEAEYLTGGRTIPGHAATRRVVNDLLREYVVIDPHKFTDLRGRIRAGTYPDHDVMSFLDCARWGTFEYANTFKDEQGYVKHRVFYTSEGKFKNEKAFRFGEDGKLRHVAMTDAMRQRFVKAEGTREATPAGPIRPDLEARMRAIGYNN